MERELCIQSCRALGNLTFGWDVDAVKDAVGASGAAAVVAATARALTVEEAAGASLFRWQAHALRNLSVRSAAMQAAIAEAGGVAVLCGGLRKHAVSARAQEAGCKALAFVVKAHEINLGAAVYGGALELAGLDTRPLLSSTRSVFVTTAPIVPH